MRSQLLDPSDAATSAVDVVRRLAGVQAQDRRHARLGIWARSKGLTAAEVERERREDRSFVRTWAMRGTVHLVLAEDVTWLREIFGHLPINESYKRLAVVGVDRDAADRAVGLMKRWLANGPMTRVEVGERLTAKGLTVEGGQALFHLARFATVKGLTVLGPEAGKQDTLVLADDWLAGTPQADPADPPAELARRYLVGHGPATFDDFASWTGLKRSLCRAGWRAIEDELQEVDVEGATLWRHRSGPSKPARTGLMRLLPMFDAMFLGYKDRSFLGPPEVQRSISAGAGIIHSFIVRDGQAISRWRLRRPRGAVLVQLEPFDGWPPDIVDAWLHEEVKDLARFETS